MKTLLRYRHLALLLLALPLIVAPSAAHAQNGTPQSPFVITTAPYTITKSGYYILGNNINYAGTSGNIITVNASNVTIDFNNFYIAGPVGNASQQVFGIYAVERSNLTIKNGTVAYCQYGILIDGNGSSTTNNVGHRVDTMRVTYCTFRGITVAAAPSSVITNCQVSKITGSTSTGSSSGYGIYCYGEGATVAECSVASIAASGNNYGIYLLTLGTFAVRNRVAGATFGIYGGKYQDNLTSNCTTPFVGGVDAGGNN